jgi:hypothetical protein
MQNNGATDEIMTDFILTWPMANGNLNSIYFNLQRIYDTVTPPPTLQVHETGWLGDKSDRTLYASSTDILSIEFEESPASSGYTIRIQFESGCVVSGSY